MLFGAACLVSLCGQRTRTWDEAWCCRCGCAGGPAPPLPSTSLALSPCLSVCLVRRSLSVGQSRKSRDPLRGACESINWI